MEDQLTGMDAADGVDPFIAFLENFRLQQLTLSEMDNMSPWSMEIRRSHGFRCYMLVGAPARLIVAPHIDEIIHPGDLVIVVDGAAHSLQSLPDGGATRLMTSYQIYDRNRIAPLLKLLPDALINRGEHGKPQADLSHIVDLYHMTASPARQVDMGLLVRLGELAFLQTARRYIEETVPADQRVRLGRDLFDVGPALTAMRQDLQRDWTLTDICREAAVSKSRLAEIFSRTLDQSPKKYLANLRMIEAAHLLDERVLSIGQIAHRVGYSSDAPFNRAFKRQFGITPGAYRLRERDARI